MTFIDPSQHPPGRIELVAPPSPTAVPRVGRSSSPGPLISRRPATMNAFDRWMSEWGPVLRDANLPTPVTNSLIAFQQQRALRGQQPLSAAETNAALYTATTHSQFTPEPESSRPWWDPRSVARSALRDVATITQSIPRIPMALVGEAQQLSSAPRHISESLNRGDYAGVLEAPGVRFLPGAYTAANLLRGDVDEIFRHPVMTALDVAPIAGRLGVGRAIAQSPAGDAARATRTALAQTRPGQFVSEAFGSQARALSRTWNRADQELRARTSVAPNAEDFSGAPAAVAEEVAAYRQAASLADRHSSITPERRAALARIAETDPAAIPNLPVPERAFLDDLRDTGAAFGDILEARGQLASYKGERYTPAQAARLNQASAALAYRETLTSVRNAAIDPTVPQSAASLQQLVDTTVPTLLDTTLPATRRRLVARGMVHVFDNAGYNADDLSKLITQRADFADIADVIRDYTTRIPRGSGRVRDKQFTAFYDDSIKFDDAYVNRGRRTLSRLEARSVPARFTPLVQEDILRRARQRGVAVGANPAVLDQLLAERRFDQFLSRDDLGRIQREAAEGWQALRDGGVSPIYIHHVSEEAARAVAYPQLSLTPPSLSQVKERLFDFAPTVADPAIAVTHQGLELLRRRGVEEFADTLFAPELGWAKTSNQLLDEYLPRARTLAARTGDDVRATAERLMRRDYAQFHPGELTPWSSKRVTGFEEGATWLPRGVVNNLRRIAKPPETPLSSLTEPVMRVFRTSLLPLSPRWHVYNLFGGAMMLGASTNPLSVWRFLGQARKMLKDPTLMPVELRRQMGLGAQLQADFNMRGGRTLRRLMDETAAGRPGAQAALRGADAATGAFGKFVQKSFDANQFVDDMYRSMAYLYGYDKTLKRGLSAAEAETRGIALSRRVLQSWDEITPLERTIMRSVFPFYGFMQHILRYSLKFPVDHPFRASIFATFGRTELEDQYATLPHRFLSAFFLGKPDIQGNQTAINLGGFNPFGDVANYFTLAGFLGSANPFITTALQASGVDTMTGSPELYPDLRYDPTSGRLIAQTSNPLSLFIQNTLPQSRVIMNLAGASDEFRDLAASNPDSAYRMLLSQAGLPILWRDYNVPQEEFKGELARQRAARDVQGDALRSGNWSEAVRYPSLRPVLNQIAQLNPEALQPYRPDAPPFDPLVFAQSALAAQYRTRPF